MSILIDTDPGIDDAIAILYALRSGQPVAAITTVAGNLGLAVTTRNAGRITALAGNAVPIHPGAAAPLHSEARHEIGIHGNDGLGGVTFPEPTSPPSAEEALTALSRHLMTQPPGSITLHCLGPLTNLARLLLTAPEVAQRLGPVIAMGGAVTEPGNAGSRAEFNLAHDAHAAATVLAAGLDLTLIPLDATRQLRADAGYINDLRATGTPAATATADLLAAYVDSARGLSRPLHDPCVPLYHARPDLFGVETLHLGVDPTTGALDPGPHAIKVALRLDAPALRTELRRGLAC